MEQFKLFWRGEFSQWHKAEMYDPTSGKTFNCCEQYMMYKKAELFGDVEAMACVMATGNPRQQQAIGRSVENFKQDVWDANARNIVAQGNYLKFTQNPRLLELISKYPTHTFVEASPMDRVWGIGFAEDRPEAQDRSKWNGKNWLGQCITAVRDRIISERDWDNTEWR